MLDRKTIIALAAIPLVWGSAALAEDTASTEGVGRPVVSAAERAAHHKDMCSGRYGHEVGRLAALETRLQLTDQQHAAWTSWSKGVTASAAATRDNCLADSPKGEAIPSALDAEARMERHLSERLHAIQSNRPALQALYGSLSAEQKEVFDRFFSPHRRHRAMLPMDHGPMEG